MTVMSFSNLPDNKLAELLDGRCTQGAKPFTVRLSIQRWCDHCGAQREPVILSDKTFRYETTARDAFEKIVEANMEANQ